MISDLGLILLGLTIYASWIIVLRTLSLLTTQLDQSVDKIQASYIRDTPIRHIPFLLCIRRISRHALALIS